MAREIYAISVTRSLVVKIERKVSDFYELLLHRKVVIFQFKHKSHSAQTHFKLEKCAAFFYILWFKLLPIWILVEIEMHRIVTDFVDQHRSIR